MSATEVDWRSRPPSVTALHYWDETGTHGGAWIKIEMQTTAVVTGAAGFIGSHLTNALCASGVRVIAIDNERSGNWKRVSPAARRIDADIAALTEGEFVDVCAGADALFHLAAEKYNSSLATPERVIATNVAATARLFRAAGRAAMRSIVFTSSLYAYGSLGPDSMDEQDLPAPTTLYGMSKVAGEHTLRVVGRETGVAWSAARLFFIYGPNQHAEGGYRSVILRNFDRLRSGLPPVINGDGAQGLDYVYVDDAVDALIRMASIPGGVGVVNVASGRAWTVSELTEAMLAVAGREGTDPDYAPPDWTAGSRRVGTTTRAREVLGWSATTPLDAGLRQVWACPEGGVGAA